jgi:DNA-binding MarR family transcriptional regulator
MAQARAISRQAMQKTIDGLLDRRWLRAQENPHHQRSSLIALTGAGTTALEKMRRREGAVLARRDRVTSAELRRTTETLRVLSEFVATAAPTSEPRPGKRRR